MKIALLVIGKTDKTYFVDAIKEYADRLQHYVPFELIVIPDLKNAKNIPEQQQKEKEGDLILKNIQLGDELVLLDERGKEFTSLKFADYMARKMQTVSKRLVFVIGGPYGFSEEVYKKAKESVTLSRMTFSHQMVRLVFVEQLYRAMTILRGEPYHHE
ncbi:MAG: 23S rRNA (pseudouridine(1915)-N(3))-methyltransferase RlmH [Bacteroidales bacterium 45-6]|nr:MAG: 23S rRNA (pseudouridine(1915)-N(3))-methyltransferase RlmH [Bacteroidales bacterium 45-6]